MNYNLNWIGQSPLQKPTVASIKRPDGRILTSQILGELLPSPKPLASLSEVLDMAIYVAFKDGSSTIHFPSVRSNP